MGCNGAKQISESCTFQKLFKENHSKQSALHVNISPVAGVSTVTVKRQLILFGFGVSVRVLDFPIVV